MSNKYKCMLGFTPDTHELSFIKIKWFEFATHDSQWATHGAGTDTRPCLHEEARLLLDQSA